MRELDRWKEDETDTFQGFPLDSKSGDWEMGLGHLLQAEV